MNYPRADEDANLPFGGQLTSPSAGAAKNYYIDHRSQPADIGLIPMPDVVRFTQVQFSRFKAFHSFTLHLRAFNILVGPNNAGKSTILTAFRILAAAMRKANTRKPEIVRGPLENTYGYSIDLKDTSVAEENIFFNYDDAEPASISFKLTNGNELLLYFRSRARAFFLLARLAEQFVVQRCSGPDSIVP